MGLGSNQSSGRSSSGGGRFEQDIPFGENTGGFGLEIVGIKQTVQALKLLPEKLRKRVLAKGLRAGGRLVVRAAKRGAPSRRGHLKKSIAVKVRQRKGQHSVDALIGPRNKKMSDGSNPGNYAHLVEKGTQPHVIPFVSFRGRDGKTKVLRNVKHPGTKAKPFLAPALDGQPQAVVMAMAEAMRAELNKIVAEVKAESEKQ